MTKQRDYDLRLFTSVLESSQEFEANLTPIATDWRRSIRANGGYWLGSFSMQGDEAALLDAFNRWLGFHVQERSAGKTSWEGLIYEMDLTLGGIKRRRSLDLLYNAVQSSYVRIDWTGELIDNGGFETVAGGDFDGWHEGAGCADETVVVYAGSHACKVTMDGAALNPVDGVNVPPNTWIRQNVNVVAGDPYKITVQGAGNGLFAVRNPNSPTGWLVAPTRISSGGTTYVGRAFYFTGPVGSEALVYCYPGTTSGDVGYFDAVSMQERGEVVGDTDWIVSQTSIDRFGRREDRLYLDDYPLESASACQQAHLAQNGQPWARPVSAGAKGAARLDITVAGYVHTANWLFVTEGDGSEANVNTWLASIVGSDYGLSAQHGGTSATAGDCQFLKAGNIATNSLQVVQKSTIDQRAWDTITEMMELGIAGSGSEPAFMPVRAWVGNGRRLHYAKVDRVPRYYLKSDGLYDKLGGEVAVGAWQIEPGVFRDMAYPVKRDLDGSFLEDARDFWVEEIEVDAAGGVLLKTSLFSEQDALDARFRYFGAGEPVDPLGGGAPTAPPHIIVGG